MRFGVYLGRHAGAGGGIGVFARAFAAALGNILEQVEYADDELVLYGDSSILTDQVREALRPHAVIAPAFGPGFLPAREGADAVFSARANERHRILIRRLPEICPRLLGGHRLSMVLDQLLLPSILRRDKPEVLHCLSNVGIIRSLLPQVVTVHDLFQAFPPEIPAGEGGGSRFASAITRRLYRYLFSKQFRSIRHVIVDSSAVGREIEQRFGFEQSKQSLVPLGLDTAFIEFWYERRAGEEQNRRVEAWLSRHKLPQDYALLLASSDPRKNLRRSVEAWLLLPAALQRKGLVVRFADKKARQAIQELIPAPIRQSCVYELPWIERADFPLLLRGALVVMMPTIAEGFGLPALEAISVGAAVVSPKLEVLEQAAARTSNCYFCDPHDVESISSALELAFENHPDFSARAPSTIGLEGAVQPGSNGTPRPRSMRDAAADCFSIYKQIILRYASGG